MIAICDALLYLSGRALVTPFQLQSYTTAAAEGWLPAMGSPPSSWRRPARRSCSADFCSAAGRGSERSAWPAIVVISLLWAALHVQYDWTGMLQIFVVGLFLGWMRWRSGSTLLTFLLHALFNLEGTLETLVQVHFLAK